MIELTREDFMAIITDIMVSTAVVPATKTTESFIDFLWKSYKENKRIITIGVK